MEKAYWTLSYPSGFSKNCMRCTFYIESTSTTVPITDCRTLKMLVHRWQTDVFWSQKIIHLYWNIRQIFIYSQCCAFSWCNIINTSISKMHGVDSFKIRPHYLKMTTEKMIGMQRIPPCVLKNNYNRTQHSLVWKLNGANIWYGYH